MGVQSKARSMARINGHDMKPTKYRRTLPDGSKVFGTSCRGCGGTIDVSKPLDKIAHAEVSSLLFEPCKHAGDSPGPSPKE